MSEKYPAQFTPGEYVIHHRDFSSPVNIEVYKNALGELFWRAWIGGKLPFKRERYYGELANASFWHSVYTAIAVDPPRGAAGF